MPKVVINCVTIPRVVIGWFPIPWIVNTWFPIPGIISDWFPMAGIIGDSSIRSRIIVCSYGLCRLNPWLRKGRVPVALGFEGCCAVVGWLGDTC
jgi:hypothetical protein